MREGEGKSPLILSINEKNPDIAAKQIKWLFHKKGVPKGAPFEV